MKSSVKPAFEKISPGFGSSVYIKQYDQVCKNKLPFWHFHPEIEIVHVNGGSGKRHIGNHLSYFDDGELIMIGANLPHYGFTDRHSGNSLETIVQMREDFLGIDVLKIPEFEHINKLFERAKMGISFHGETKLRIGKRIDELVGMDPFNRLINLLSILEDLATTSEYKILNVEGMVLEINRQDNIRMDKIYHFVRDNYARQISLEEISQEVSMTVPSFCRYFKKITGKTFTRFVNEYRLVHASKLLVEKPTSITDICYESGFNNFSHFNKLFKEFTGKSPSEYRKKSKHFVN
jgi:AraC-like DNA-binding protein